MELTDQEDSSSNGEDVSLEKFFQKQFPFYLSIGMTYDQYWNGDCFLIKDYKEAYLMRIHRENERDWRMGLYIYNAMINVSPILRAFAKDAKPLPYMAEPLPVTEKDYEEMEARRAKEQAMQMKAKILRIAEEMKKQGR